MRFALASEHREYFSKNHFIEFDDLLAPQEIEVLKTHADSLLAKKLKSSRDLFVAAHDLWRKDPALKKIILNSRFAEIAAALCKENHLRIGYDQLLISSRESPLTLHTSLRNLSSFDPLACALLLRLTDGDKTSPYMPSKSGSGIFFSPGLSLPWKIFFELPDQLFLLIAYCPEKTIYRLNQNDLHTHLLKKDGYVFGDLVRSSSHPLLF